MSSLNEAARECYVACRGDILCAEAMLQDTGWRDKHTAIEIHAAINRAANPPVTEHRATDWYYLLLEANELTLRTNMGLGSVWGLAQLGDYEVALALMNDLLDNERRGIVRQNSHQEMRDDRAKMLARERQEWRNENLNKGCQK